MVFWISGLGFGVGAQVFGLGLRFVGWELRLYTKHSELWNNQDFILTKAKDFLATKSFSRGNVDFLAKIFCQQTAHFYQSKSQVFCKTSKRFA